MARKRMFDKAIIETDAFLNVSLSAKALYFLLSMEADDEGFVSPNRVLRLYGGEVGDIKNLMDVGLVIRFKSGVLVVTNWNQNNYLDKNRISPTQYQEEKKLLLLTDRNKYELNNRLTGVQPVESSRVESSRDTAPKVADAPFSLKESIKKLEDNKRRDLNIIALYLEKKKPDIKTSQQLQVLLRRHLRAAKSLTPFDDHQILGACTIAEKEYPKIWTIETLVKILTR